MKNRSARMFVAAIVMSSMVACSNNGAQPDQPENMQVYFVELPQRDSDVSWNEGVIEESSVSPRGQSDQLEPQVQIKSAVLLDQTYTIQIGVFDDAASASLFVSEEKIDAEESGIATVTLDGKPRFILAYGMYYSESEAKNAAEQLAYRVENPQAEEPFKVVTLAEIRAISETVNANSDILEIGSF